MCGHLSKTCLVSTISELLVIVSALSTVSIEWVMVSSFEIVAEE